MGRTQFTKEILSQIDKATNKDRDLGRVIVNDPTVIKFAEREEVDNPIGISFEFSKRAYNFDRGPQFSLNRVSFNSFAGRKRYGTINTNLGNFLDDGFEAYENVHYAVMVYSESDREINFRLLGPRCSVSVYKDGVQKFDSANNYFSTGVIELSLTQGWNTLDIFYYRQTAGGYLQMDGDIGVYVSNWKSVDFEPPNTPQWHYTPIITEYIDPDDFGGQFQNVLKWRKVDEITEISGAPDSIDPEPLWGWDVEKAVATRLLTPAGNVNNVVSGWGTHKIIVAGDVRHLFPSEGNVYIPDESSPFVISGSSYPSGDDTQTLVTMTTAISPSPSDPIWVQSFRPIISIINDAGIPNVVSGVDRDVVQDQTYYYRIKAIDLSPYANRSDPTSIESILTGDFVAPGNVTIDATIAGVDSIGVNFTAPTDADQHGVQVEVKEDGGAYGVLTNMGSSPGLVQHLTVMQDKDGVALAAGTQYNIRLKAFDWKSNLATGVETGLNTTTAVLTTAVVSGTLQTSSNTYFYGMGTHRTQRTGSISILSEIPTGANVPNVTITDSNGNPIDPPTVSTVVQGEIWEVGFDIDGNQAEGVAWFKADVTTTEGDKLFGWRSLHIDYSPILPTVIFPGEDDDDGGGARRPVEQIWNLLQSPRTDKTATLIWDPIDLNVQNIKGAPLRELSIWRSTVPDNNYAHMIAAVPSGTVQFVDNDALLIAGHQYTYWLRAEDEAGNISPMVSGSRITLQDPYNSHFKNYLDNANFQRQLSDEPIGWTSTNSPGVTSGTNAYDGDFSIEVDNNDYFTSPNFFLEPNTPMVLSLYAMPKSGVSPGVDVKATIHYTNVSGSAISSETLNFNTTSADFTRYYDSLTIPSSAAYASIDFESDHNTNRVIIDAIQLEESSSMPTPFEVSRIQTSDRIAVNAIKAHHIETDSLSSITANMGSLTAGNIVIDSNGYIRGGQTAYETGDGFFLGYEGGTYKFSIGTSSSKMLTWDGTNLTLNGGLVTSIATGSEVAIQEWRYGGQFTSSDYNTVVWNDAYDLELLDGTSYTISNGTTGNMGATTYIYLDIGVSTTAFQTTTTQSNSVGSGKILVCVAHVNSDNTSDALFQSFGGAGGAVWGTENIAADAITANEISAITITANEIAANAITATQINASAVTANKIDANAVTTVKLDAGAVTATKINVSELSAINADLGSITAGTIVLPSSGYIRAGQSAYDTGTGFYLGNDGGTPKFSIGNSSARKLTWNGSALTIDGVITTSAGSTIDVDHLSGSINSAQVNIASRGWMFNGLFSVTDSNTVQWTSGTLTLADGTTYSIVSGNTGNMSAINYIYLDIGASVTVLQVSTTASNAVGDGKILVAVAEDNTTEAVFQVFGGTGGLSVDATDIVAGSIVAANIASNTITASEIASNTITASEIDAATITATEMSVSQLSAITANMGSITSGDIVIDSSGFIRGGQSAYDTGDGFWIGYNSGAYKFSIGSPGSKSMVWDGTDLTINGSILTSIQGGSEVAIQGWQYEGEFSSSDYNTVAWNGTQTLTLLDGTTYSIVAGNTGNMSGGTTYYIYLAIGTSTTALQVTSTPANAVGSGKILIAVAWRNDDNTSDALFQVYGGRGGAIWTTENIAADTITANEIAAETITANEIAANAITATQINADAVTANKIDVSQLSAITANMGSMTAGSITGGTITGGTIRTSTSNQRLEILGSDNTLKFYDSAGNLAINMDDDIWGLGLPGISFPLATGGVITMGTVSNDYCTLTNNWLFIHSTNNNKPAIHGRNESVAIGGAEGVVGQYTSDGNLANTGDKRVGVWGTSYLDHANSTDSAVGVYAYGGSTGDAPAIGLWAKTDADGGGFGLAGFFEGDVLISGTLKTEKSPHNVKAYGAVGDGSTDDTVAIQMAMDATYGTGGRVLFPTGTYKITGTISGTNNISIEGEGSSSTLKMVKPSSSPKSMILFKETMNASISNIRLDGDFPTNSAASRAHQEDHGIYCNTTSGTNINHVWVVDTGGNSIHFDGIGLKTAIIGSDIDGAGRSGIDISHHQDIILSNNIVKNCDEVGIYLHGATATRNHRLILNNNICNDNVTGISLTYTGAFSVNGNVCVNTHEGTTQTAGINCNYAVSGTLVGNTVYDNTVDGIKITNATAVEYGLNSGPVDIT